MGNHLLTDGSEGGLPDLDLRKIERTQTIRGISLPQSISYRQLIVTGPPGCGKTTLIRALGGWPEEGYVDLTHRAWWRSRAMSLRPREVHLGFPFEGRREGLALFEQGWLKSAEPLRLQLDRICLPPRHRRWSFVNWRRKYVFEFLLPPAEKVLAARQERAYLQTHHVDAEVSLEQVRAQLLIHWIVAGHLHRKGLRVYIRDDFDGPPKIIGHQKEPEPEPESITDRLERALQGALERLGGIKSQPVLVDQFDELHLVGEKARLRLDLLPVEIVIGPQRVQAHLVRPLAAPKDAWPAEVMLIDPEDFSARISGLVRLAAGQRTRIGKGAEDRQISMKLPDEILPRLEIANEGDALAITDLHSPSGTDVRPLPDQTVLPNVLRLRRLDRLAEIYGGPLEILDTKEALDRIERVNDILSAQAHRPRDSHGRPGGLVEIPKEITPVFVGDLHANLENLLKVLAVNRFLDEMEAGRAVVILLGDAIHREDEGRLEEMDSSILMMDFIFSCILAFPANFFYMRGNHDTFSHEVNKEGVPQGHLWRRRLKELRGEIYVRAMQKFYDLLPFVAMSNDFVACHAGPPSEAMTRQRLIDVRRNERAMHQLTWNRVKRPNKPAGYTQREVKQLLKGVGADSDAAFIVSHNPQPDGRVVWHDLGGIRNHHLVYSARPGMVAVITRVGGRFESLTYRVGPLLDILGVEPSDRISG